MDMHHLQNSSHRPKRSYYQASQKEMNLKSKNKNMSSKSPLTLFSIYLYYSCNFFLITTTSATINNHHEHVKTTPSSIIFATLGRSSYNFDIYTIPINKDLLHNHWSTPKELKITDSISVNFNGYFPNTSSSPLYSKSSNPASPFSILSNSDSLPTPSIELVYITERNGTSTVYYDAIFHEDSRNRPKSRSSLEVPARVQLPLVGGNRAEPAGQISMKDRPSLVGEYLIYVSTHQDPGSPRTSWAAVYSTHVGTGSTRRLTPEGVADFSPSVSPSGIWTAVASFRGKDGGWDGEVEELGTDIDVFLTRDGSERVRVVEHGGWPCWADDYTIYFHRRSKDDGWWSVYKASLPREGRATTSLVSVERVTPPGLHAFTPATSAGNKNFIAVATRRFGSDYRHIELFDLVKKEFKEVTRPLSPETHHFNPFLSTDSSSRVGYHKCRGVDSEKGKRGDHFFLENLQHPVPDVSLLRIDGSFPSFSPAGDRIAYVNFPGLYVVDRDGSNQREIYKGTAFSTAWDPVRSGVVYSSVGPTFASEGTKVDIISIHVDANDGDNSRYKKLTTGGENNAFPFPSPDGKWLVFRSGRSGHKKLYIMDAVNGEKGGIRRLTEEGPWTDTMANWSPDGEWIAFSSDRDRPGSGSFELFMIHPNGTGLHKVIKSGSEGRVNHPWFSPDGRRIVFTSDYAAVSAEPISNPHHYQPYGDIFVAQVDGSDIQRMTHNSYEDGTPTWGPTYIRPVDVAQPIEGPRCNFEDCQWLNVKPKKPKHDTNC